LLRRQRLAGQATFESPAFQEFHDDERLTRQGINIVNRADVRMVQSRGRPRLALEAFEGLGVLGVFMGQELQSHEPAQADVLRFVDNAHAAAAEHFRNAIVRNHLPGVEPDPGADSGVNLWTPRSGSPGAGLPRLDSKLRPAGRANDFLRYGVA